MGSKVLREAAEIAQLFRDQSRFPSVSRADVGPVITSRYGGQYSNVYTEWTQRDLERNENVKFCRQYIVFHDEKSVVYSGPSGNCTEIKGQLLSMDSPSGEMKAIWHKNRKLKCLNLTTLNKHGKVYEDEAARRSADRVNESLRSPTEPSERHSIRVQVNSMEPGGL
ncbi:hypothetical protein DNTS_029022 [Danionella cerebrum]|uniref:Uncharacterized protein n=1 Tax=Danionella cerebrum TaxID=2873325 RepID=A0A553MXR5_9TELE|nr:hypothetical protein DNTS_029022 [Danionella translucida]